MLASATNIMTGVILILNVQVVMPILLFCLMFIIAAFFFMQWFTRDPERITPSGESLILSAADGRVCDIEHVQEDLYFHGKGIRVGVYLSLFDVHVNRIPISGVVRFLSYKTGSFFPAHRNRASLHNEHQIIGIENERCKILVKQIAGFIARRIVCRLRLGDVVRAGERFGKITLGSRVELIVPTHIDITIHVGDRVKAGETIIGVMK
jgi:phosphatidylserine decarboxylase